MNPVLGTVIAAAITALACEGAVLNLTLWSPPDDRFSDQIDWYLGFDTELGSTVHAQVWRYLPNGEPGVLVFNASNVVVQSPDTPASITRTSLMFGTDQLGIPVQVGTYPDADRDSIISGDRAGLSLSYGSSGYSALTGRFIIHSLAYSNAAPGDYQVESFRASFVIDAQYSRPETHGELEFSLTAIPAPGPGALLALGSWCGLVRRRRKRHPGN